MYCVTLCYVLCDTMLCIVRHYVIYCLTLCYVLIDTMLFIVCHYVMYGLTPYHALFDLIGKMYTIITLIVSHHILMELLCIISSLLLPYISFCSPHVNSSYIEHQWGDLPLIISVPHGGYQKPDNYHDRQDGCHDSGSCQWPAPPDCQSHDNCQIATTPDMMTQELAREIADAIEDMRGVRPHMVISDLSR